MHILLLNKCYTYIIMYTFYKKILIPNNIVKETIGAHLYLIFNTYIFVKVLKF